MSKMKHIKWSSVGADIQDGLPVSVREFVRQIGRAILADETVVSSGDLENLIDFANQTIADAVAEYSAGLSKEAYLAAVGGGAEVLYDAIYGVNAWPERLEKLVQPYDRRPELVICAYALYQMDSFVELRKTGDFDAAIDAFGEAANAMHNEALLYAFERPVKDGFAVDLDDHNEKLKETAQKTAKEKDDKRSEDSAVGGRRRSEADEDSRRYVFEWLEENYHKHHPKRAPAVRAIISARLVGSAYDTIDKYVKEYVNHKKAEK